MLVNVLQFSVCYVFVLLLVQLAWQALTAAVKHFYLWKLKRRLPTPPSPLSDGAPHSSGMNSMNSNKNLIVQNHPRNDTGDPDGPMNRTAMGIPFIRFAGDNSPKKRIIAHDSFRSFTLNFVAAMLTYLILSDTDLLTPLSLLTNASWACVVSLTMKLSNCFILLKIYSESGIGLNFYYRGFRVLGIDYHAWQIRQDPNTGKPLLPSQQFMGPARLHLDIPPWNLHHWPYETFDDAQKLESLMSQKNALRAEKKARKEQKRFLYRSVRTFIPDRARREEKLRQKQETQLAIEAIKEEDEEVIEDVTDLLMLNGDSKKDL